MENKIHKNCKECRYLGKDITDDLSNEYVYYCGLNNREIIDNYDYAIFLKNKKKNIPTPFWCKLKKEVVEEF